LLAKRYGGQFILRIEDTDTVCPSSPRKRLTNKKRTVDGAVEELCTMLKWAGIEWDEGNPPNRCNVD